MGHRRQGVPRSVPMPRKLWTLLRSQSGSRREGCLVGLPRTAVPRERRISSARGEKIKQSTRRWSSWSKAKNKNKKIRTWRRSRINDACHAPTSLKVCHSSKVRHPSANHPLALTVYVLFWLTPPTRPRSSLSHSEFLRLVACFSAFCTDKN